MLLDKMKAEILGSLLINFIITTSAINYTIGENSLIAYATSILFVYAIFTWVAVPISGGIFNPIITISLIITNHLDFFKGLLLLTVQFIGTFAGLCLTKSTLPQEIIYKLIEDSNSFGLVNTQSFFTALCLEAIGGFLVVYVYYKLVLEKNSFEFSGGIGMGMVYFFLSIFMINKTGAVFNLYRPYLNQLLINPSFNTLFYLGSLGGGLLGGLIGNLELSETAEESRKRIKREKHQLRTKSKMYDL